jgi:hypothetical protein
MTVVHSDHRISPCAEAKMASMALALARTRLFLVGELEHSRGSEHLSHLSLILNDIDEALDGTVNSFTKNGAWR